MRQGLKPFPVKAQFGSLPYVVEKGNFEFVLGLSDVLHCIP